MATELTVGTRVYNHGDRANIDHFGTITEVRTDQWGTNYQITPDADSTSTEPYWVFAAAFANEYQGNGLTRFVTEDAYQDYRETQLRQLRAAAGMH